MAERDALLIMTAYRHGLRASEIGGLRWDQIDLKASVLHVTRLALDSSAARARAARTALLEAPAGRDGSVCVHFTGPMAIRTIHYVVAEAGKRAGLKFPVHPNMLRHATGFYLANAGHDTRAIQLYLGHKNIQHTARYTEFWKD